jgi:hypothetical protein
MKTKIVINGNEYYYSYSRRGEFGEHLYIQLYTLGEKITKNVTTRKYLFFGEKTVQQVEEQLYDYAFHLYVGFEQKDLNFDKLKTAEENYHKRKLMAQGNLSI